MSAAATPPAPRASRFRDAWTVYYRSRTSEQRFGEGFGVERTQVVRFFADADVPDRGGDLPRHGEDDPSFRRPVELGERDPRHTREFLERLRLRDRVAPAGRVEDEEHFVGSP